jgi:hypothetical protein
LKKGLIEKDGYVVYNKHKKGIIIKKQKEIMVRKRNRIVVCNRQREKDK